jgi:transposase
LEPNTLWVGIDVGRYFHALCVVDSAGQVVWQRKRVANTTLTIRAALHKLRRFAEKRPLVFATEEVGGNATTLVRLLFEAGETVYLAQPLRVHRFQLALGQPHKSDPYDAQVIAQFARQNQHGMPRVRPSTPDLQALRVLSRRLEAVSKDLRRCVNRLRGTLAEYVPEWLVCRVFSDWSSQAALGTLDRYGRVSKLQRTPTSRLAQALSAWTRGRFGEEQARTLREALGGVSLPPCVEEAYYQAIRSLVGQIRSLLAEKERLLELVKAQGESVPTLAAIQRELGYGLETAAVIASEVGDVGDFPIEARFATYCGVTPLKRTSGISQGSSRLSRFTNKRLLRAIFQATVAVITKDERSREYYHRKLAGRSDPGSRTTALLALARHRTRRLYRVLRQASLASHYPGDLAA